MSVVITGSLGQLGTAFRSAMPDAVHLTRADLDLTDAAAIAGTLETSEASAVINCAGYTAVDQAEAEEELATLVNGTAVGVLAAYCTNIGIPMVTFSTDYVFDGQKREPYVESDPTDPINAYGRSKLVGERLALEAGALVIRTSWVISGTHPNFVATMLRLGQTRALRVVDDQHGCPTIAADLVAGTVAALKAGVTGLLHLCNSDPTTWFELADAALHHAGFQAAVEPCGTDEFPTPARRPVYSVLGSERRADLGIEALPSWRSSLPSVVDGLFANGVVERA